MKTFKKALAMAIALPLTLGSASALAYGGGGHNGGKHNGCDMQDGRKVFRALDLTDAQQDEMKSLREANRAAMTAQRQGLRAAMQENHDQMQTLMLADNFDDAAVRELARKMSADQAEHRMAMLENRHKILSILTPEQKEKYKQLQSDRRAKCEARWAEKKQ
ncbi:CpxP family protein [Photobacterium lipolyticum]|uniref:Stress adaptor protein CpxP n=1 Tax=Photobacterium lipolyticum TaxID=266810 RepID=A0A2T3MYI2_9GAMM|nr:CpxP family protein [Photobacterium lipolyticum]PSW04901.1 stress adaptor protein CpxP [Photobacterium lipolyticum]